MNDEDDYYSRKQARADAVLPYLVKFGLVLLVISVLSLILN